jgi:AcrR family transcriptional regulator
MNIITPEAEAQEPAGHAQAARETGPAAQVRGGAETRQRLVESALEVFSERGYHAATLSEIAARAGLTT